jgi:hypothetical protein
MAPRTRSLGRTPTDLRARDRLRQAQAAEARALTRVCAAQASLATAARVVDDAPNCVDREQCVGSVTVPERAAMPHRARPELDHAVARVAWVQPPSGCSRDRN